MSVGVLQTTFCFNCGLTRASAFDGGEVAGETGVEASVAGVAMMARKRGFEIPEDISVTLRLVGVHFHGNCEIPARNFKKPAGI